MEINIVKSNFIQCIDILYIYLLINYFWTWQINNLKILKYFQLKKDNIL